MRFLGYFLGALIGASILLLFAYLWSIPVGAACPDAPSGWLGYCPEGV